MRRGVWHQFGDRSQKLILEQLELANGVGVVLGSRDLSLGKAQEYASQYVDLGADLLLDLQFFRSTFENRHTPSYELDAYRQSVSELKKLSSSQLTGLTRSIEKLNRRFRTVGVIAPALMYEAERPDIADLNRTLFEAAKSAAEAIRRANICFRGTWRKRHGGARCHKYSLEPCDESARAGVLFRLRI
jgi:hypothetical protein